MFEYILAHGFIGAALFYYPASAMVEKTIAKMDKQEAEFKRFRHAVIQCQGDELLMRGHSFDSAARCVVQLFGVFGAKND